MYPPPGLDGPNHVTEHPTTRMTTTTGLDDDVHSLRHPQRHRFHLKTAPVVHWIWTQCQRAQMRQERTQLQTDFSVPFNTLDVCGYKVEEDDGSPQLQSIWQPMQAN